MAIKKNLDLDEVIELFIKNSLFLKDYESTDKIIKGEKHDYNLAKKVSGEISKTVKILLSSEEGLIKFIKLLDDSNIAISASAAEFLYPLYPQKSLKILKQYSKSLKNKLDSYKVDTKIEGLNQKQAFFMDGFKKIYNCEDLESLNREKDIKVNC